MSKVFKISYGSETDTIEKKNIKGGPEKKTVKDAIEERIALFNDNLLMDKVDKSKISKFKYDLEKDKVISIREGEKSILKQLLEGAINQEENKKIEMFNLIGDTIDQIENDGDHSTLTEDDINRIINSFESIEAKSPMMLKYRQLFKQLAKPEEVNGNKEDKKPEDDK